MAFTDNTLQSYSDDEPTVREDLQDYISIMSPVDMPLFSILGTRPIGQRKFEWPVDDVPFDSDPSNIAAATDPEGRDAQFVTPTYRTRLYNFAQINAISIDVSDTARVVDMAGVPDEFQYQLWRRLLQLGRKMEFAAHFGTGANYTASQLGASPFAGGRVTHGLMNWLNVLGLARALNDNQSETVARTLFTGGPSVPYKYQSTCYNSAGTDLTRDILYTNILAPAWQNGFNVGGAIVMCGTALKKMISDFALVSNGPRNQRNIPAQMKKLVDTIDVIETPLGTVYVNLDRYLDISSSMTYTTVSTASPAASLTSPINEMLIAFQQNAVRMGILRGVGFKPLADVGDSSKGMLVGEWGVQVDNPLALTGGINLD
jgi:hypothetical protein